MRDRSKDNRRQGKETHVQLIMINRCFYYPNPVNDYHKFINAYCYHYLRNINPNEKKFEIGKMANEEWNSIKKDKDQVRRMIKKYLGSTSSNQATKPKEIKLGDAEFKARFTELKNMFAIDAEEATDGAIVICSGEETKPLTTRHTLPPIQPKTPTKVHDEDLPRTPTSLKKSAAKTSFLDGKLAHAPVDQSEFEQLKYQNFIYKQEGIYYRKLWKLTAVSRGKTFTYQQKAALDQFIYEASVSIRENKEYRTKQDQEDMISGLMKYARKRLEKVAK